MNQSSSAFIFLQIFYAEVFLSNNHTMRFTWMIIIASVRMFLDIPFSLLYVLLFNMWYHSNTFSFCVLPFPSFLFF